jgi:hypothetical protein
MTNNDAIDLLDNLIGMIDDNQENDYDTALKMAIKALEELPKRRKEVKRWKRKALGQADGDFISRPQALNTICKGKCDFDFDKCPFTEHCGHINLLLSVPSVDIPSAEPKTGHWIPIYQGDEIINYRCSECELGDTNGSTNLYGWDYCRRCGTKMVKPQESEEEG